MRKIVAVCLVLGGLIPTTAWGADSITRDTLKHELRALLQKNPEIVLDVLRENSETVLDIAQQGSNQRRKRSLEAQWQVDSTQPKTVALDSRPVLGPKDAPVTIVAFSDFTCPYCEQGAKTVSKLVKKYGNQVRLVFKHMPLSQEGVAQLASAYFIAAGLQSEEKAWKLYDAMFAERDQLIAEEEAYLKKTAEKIGLNMSQLRSDVKSRKIQKIINEDMADAKKLNIEGTPYFLVNNMVVRGALPYDLFKDAVEMALKKK